MCLSTENEQPFRTLTLLSTERDWLREADTHVCILCECVLCHVLHRAEIGIFLMGFDFACIVETFIWRHYHNLICKATFLSACTPCRKALPFVSKDVLVASQEMLTDAYDMMSYSPVEQGPPPCDEPQCEPSAPSRARKFGEVEGSEFESEDSKVSRLDTYIAYGNSSKMPLTAGWITPPSSPDDVKELEFAPKLIAQPLFELLHELTSAVSTRPARPQRRVGTPNGAKRIQSSAGKIVEIESSPTGVICHLDAPPSMDSNPRSEEEEELEIYGESSEDGELEELSTGVLVEGGGGQLMDDKAGRHIRMYDSYSSDDSELDDVEESDLSSCSLPPREPHLPDAPSPPHAPRILATAGNAPPPLVMPSGFLEAASAHPGITLTLQQRGPQPLALARADEHAPAAAQRADTWRRFFWLMFVFLLFGL